MALSQSDFVAKPSAVNSSPHVKLYIFPTFAYADQRQEDAWRVRVDGVCLKSKTRRIKKKVLVNLLKRLIDVDDAQLDTELCQSRMEPFFLAPSKKRKITFRLDDRPLPIAKKTKRNGQFRGKLLVPHTDLTVGSVQKGAFGLSAADQKTDTFAGDLSVQMIEPEGRSIISDIDDTIKFSNVENRVELLKNTFMRDFTAIEGMPAIYQQLFKLNYRFHYVTASPWQLFEPLQQFIDADYPKGSMHFRTFRLSDHLLKLSLIHISEPTRPY